MTWTARAVGAAGVAIILSGCEASVFLASALGTTALFEADVANQRHVYRPTGTFVVLDDGARYPVETRVVYQKDSGAFRYRERMVDVNGNKVECGDSCPNAVRHFLKVNG